jgi:hypothetical protein
MNRSRKSAGADFGVNARAARRGARAPMSRLERFSRPEGAAKPVAFQATEKRSMCRRFARDIGRGCYHQVLTPAGRKTDGDRFGF